MRRCDQRFPAGSRTDRRTSPSLGPCRPGARGTLGCLDLELLLGDDDVGQFLLLLLRLLGLLRGLLGLLSLLGELLGGLREILGGGLLGLLRGLLGLLRLSGG